VGSNRARAVKNNASLDIYSDKATKRGGGEGVNGRDERGKDDGSSRAPIGGDSSERERERAARGLETRGAAIRETLVARKADEGGGTRGGRGREREREGRETAGRRG